MYSSSYLGCCFNKRHFVTCLFVYNVYSINTQFLRRILHWIQKVEYKVCYEIWLLSY